MQTSPKHRSLRIDAGRQILDRSQWLMQWHYTQRYTDRFGTGIVSGFRSIVTRPGMPGLWLDRPYYCYSGGVHRYRCLPRHLAARVLVCCARGYLHEAMRVVVARLRQIAWRLTNRIRYYAPAKIMRRRAQSRYWRELLGE